MWSAILEQLSWIATIVGLITSVLAYRAASRAARADQRRIMFLLRVIAVKTGDEEIGALLAEAAAAEQVTAKWRGTAKRWARVTLSVLAVPVLLGAYLASAVLISGSEIHGFNHVAGDKPIVENRRCIGAQDCLREGTISYLWHTDADSRAIDSTLGSDTRKNFHTFITSVLVRPHEGCDGAAFTWKISVAGTEVASGSGPTRIETAVHTDNARIHIVAARTDSHRCEADLVLKYPILDHGLSGWNRRS